MLVKNLHIQLVRPPVPIRPSAMGRVGVRHRTLARTLDLGIHYALHCAWLQLRHPDDIGLQPRAFCMAVRQSWPLHSRGSSCIWCDHTDSVPLV
ncbi:hypothetical protein SS05631_b59210 (plasmid) [Sinorhizobium sp. CCBAU 05631]|nr:hypothetical protein SS05631_b59210 [Sinorhizobium sp. CCBAU 05631]